MILSDDPSTATIDRGWPVEELETIEACPYCGSANRHIAHENVQDWSFYCAPGKWTYWVCNDCDSLHLNPRPTQRSIPLAYSAYYTHGYRRATLLERIRERMRNEYWSSTLNANFRPRLHLAGGLRRIMSFLHLRAPFAMKELAGMPAGRLMDVGCGDGSMLKLAEGLGWSAVGLEIDGAAVQIARSRGLEVVEGSYSRLVEHHEEFDCIICSHVLEHVHDPGVMISNLYKALKPGGVLLLSLPNASSKLRAHFGNNWRGLEAPRHLTIPSLRRLEAILNAAGFSVRQVLREPIATAVESARIQRRGAYITRKDLAEGRRIASRLVISSGDKYDFLELVCIRTISSGLASESSTLQAVGNEPVP